MVPFEEACQLAHQLPMPPFQKAGQEAALVRHFLGKALVFGSHLEHAKLDLVLPVLGWADGNPLMGAAAPNLVHHTCYRAILSSVRTQFIVRAARVSLCLKNTYSRVRLLNSCFPCCPSQA